METDYSPSLHQKLYTKLPANAVGHLPNTRARPLAANDAAETPLSGWHAHVLIAQRHNCAIFVHDATRFPVLTTCLTKPDLGDAGSIG